ncbi:hypothetical protein [Planctomicrobium sp. SH664]|uniref:hypothetical protein n=1 Tax=Planctomicrobium sp. SH664 TaxID=3448125 RepID=UPI003F5C548B
MEIPVEIPDRFKIAANIQRFLRSEITAFEFDELLDESRCSADPVVRYVAGIVWYFYDDCVDHRVALSRQGWGFLQRLLLILQSDCVVKKTSTRIWSVSQLCAGCCLLLIGTWCCLGGWRYWPILAGIAGLAAWLIAKFRPQPWSSADAPLAEAIYPFASFTDLHDAYDSARFIKERFPPEVGERRIRNGNIMFGQRALRVMAFLFYGPIALLLQTFPVTVRRTVVHFAATKPCE